jgi:hypothetical protein
MLLRPFLNDATSCASYVFGCGTLAKVAVVDPHADLVDPDVYPRGMPTQLEGHDGGATGSPITMKPWPPLVATG